MKKDLEWEIIKGSGNPPHLQQALEEVLLDKVSKGERNPTLRFWEDIEKNVMLGRFQSVKNEVNEEKAEEDGVVISRRITGGGAMFTEPRCQITYSLYFPEDLLESDRVKDSYAELDKFAIETLNELGYNARHEPINDIVTSEGKVGGAAQIRRKGTVLHHTRIAYEMDVKKIAKYLKIGEEKICDKSVKSAEKRVKPLKDQKSSIERSKVVESLSNSFIEDKKIKFGEITEDEVKAAKGLVERKFGTDKWIYRIE